MTKIAIFEIPGRLPGLNEIIAATNSHRYVGASLKKKTTEMCGEWIIVRKVPEFFKPVNITIEWFEPNRKRDVDNICAGAKFILDALVDTERLENDTRKWVKTIKHEFPEPDKENPRVRISIAEA